jgi:hypothetical protein
MHSDQKQTLKRLSALQDFILVHVGTGLFHDVDASSIVRKSLV